MKIYISCLGAVTLMLFSVFALAAQANAGDAGDNVSHQPRHASRFRRNTDEPQQASVANADSGYGNRILHSFCSAYVKGVCTDGAYPEAELIQDGAGNLYGTTENGGANNEGTVFKLAPPTQPGGVWTETVLYSFCSVVVKGICTDGAYPEAGLMQDAAGNLYSTSGAGGANDEGTVFELAPPAQPGGPWIETVLYSFCSVVIKGVCTDGLYPEAGLIQDGTGSLYSITEAGGANDEGAVFELAPPTQPGGVWTETVLYSFCPGVLTGVCPDGRAPKGGLIQDVARNLYGTTDNGGTNNDAGTVFKLAPPAQPSGVWTETVLYNFCSELNTAICTDGVFPQAGLIQDAAGNLYGTTAQGGGTNGGTVFELNITGQETVLYSFCTPACTGATVPEGSLVLDTRGNLYSTTPFGGGNYNGTVFEVDTTGQETVLYSFCSVGVCTDGRAPEAGLIVQPTQVMDAAGNLYGTTESGGANNEGVVFVVQPQPSVTVTCPPSTVTPCPSITTAQALRVSIAVTDGSGNPTPTGTVTLNAVSLVGTVTYTSAATLLTSGSCIIPLASTSCVTITIPAGSLVVGADTLTASYTGDGNYSPATGINSVAVTSTSASLLTPAVTVTPSASSITTAQALNVNVVVSGGNGTPTPTGTVTLTSGSYSSGATSLSSGNATINMPTASFAVGTDTLTASYSGDSNYTTAAATSSVTVMPFSIAGTAALVVRGATKTSMITVTPTGGFTGSVTLTAAITASPAGAQDPPTLSFGSTSPVVITGASAETATLTISTTAATSAAIAPASRPGFRWYAASSMGLGFMLLFFASIPARGRGWRTRLGLLVLPVILASGLLACGGGGSSGGGGGGTGNPGTTPGNYTVTVTATSGSATTNGTVTLTVQ